MAIRLCVLQFDREFTGLNTVAIYLLFFNFVRTVRSDIVVVLGQAPGHFVITTIGKLRMSKYNQGLADLLRVRPCGVEPVRVLDYLGR